MIQRIQSLYLFISVLALGLMFFFPVSGYFGEYHTLRLTVFDFESLVPGEENIFQSYFTWPLLFLLCLSIILSLLSIFQYRKRKRQMKTIKTGILFNVILIVAVFLVYSRLILAQLNVDEEYNIGAFLPLLSLVFFVLAYRGVKKDEDLVRSMDRLR